MWARFWGGRGKKKRKTTKKKKEKEKRKKRKKKTDSLLLFALVCCAKRFAVALAEAPWWDAPRVALGAFATRARALRWRFAANMEQLRPNRPMVKAAELQGAFGVAVYAMLDD